jgi:LysM repeat protein
VRPEVGVDPAGPPGGDTGDRPLDLAGIGPLRFAPPPASRAESTRTYDAPPAGACRYLHLTSRSDAACLALSHSSPLGWRQVDLVCVGAGHTECPRFLHGGAGERPLPLARLLDAVGPPREPAAGANLVPGGAAPILGPRGMPEGGHVDIPAPDERSADHKRNHRSPRIAQQARRPAIAFRPAILGAMAVLAAAFILAIGFVAARGGLDLPGSIAPSLDVVAGSSSLPTSTPASAPVSPPSTGSSATPSTSPSPTARPKPTRTPKPSSSSGTSIPPDRLALLTPCPNEPGCFQYRVRPGESLRGIAAFFGVPYAAILDLNPQIRNPSIIHVGELVKIPAPGP